MSEKLTRTQQKNLERLGGVNPADESFSRRQFLTQVGGAAVVAGAGGGRWALDPRPLGHEGDRTAAAGAAEETISVSRRRAGRRWSWCVRRSL